MRTSILALVVSIVGCSSGMDRVALDTSFECRERLNDDTGFLEPICEYLVANFDSYGIDPNTLDVVRTIPGQEWTQTQSQHADSDHVFVGLSCCLTGDWAVVDQPSGSVVEFILGDQ